MPVIEREQIVEAALGLAEQMGWEAVRLFQVAQQLDCRLEDLRAHFREKDDIVQAWFDRADRALLLRAADADCQALPVPERQTELLMAWLGALAPHRRVTRQMIAGRFEPGHIHITWAGLLRVSRTVQWWREAARCDTRLPRRALDEVLYTGIFSATFAYWLWDDSFQSVDTRRRLGRLLGCGTGRGCRVPEAATVAAEQGPAISS